MHYFDARNKQYVCCCGQSVGANLTSFLYRRLIQVNTSDKVTLDYHTDKRSKIFVIGIKYDLFRLLLMSNYSSKFARIRAEEVRKIKKELYGQRYFPKTFIDCVITANPIILKIKILETFVGNDFVYGLKLPKLKYKDLNEFWDCIKGIGQFTDEAGSIIDLIIEKYIQWKGDIIFNEPVAKLVIVGKLDFYVRLLLIGKIITQYGKGLEIGGGALTSDQLHTMVLKLASCPWFIRWDLKNMALQYLCTDYLWQCKNEISSDQFCGDVDMEAYYDMYMQTDFISDEVTAYTNISQYGEVVERCIQKNYSDPLPIDFYSDLYLFYELNEYNKAREK